MTKEEYEIVMQKKIIALKSMIAPTEKYREPTGYLATDGREIHEGDYLLNQMFYDDWVVQYKNGEWVATLLYYNEETENFEVDMSEDIEIAEFMKIQGSIYDL